MHLIGYFHCCFPYIHSDSLLTHPLNTRRYTVQVTENIVKPTENTYNLYDNFIIQHSIHVVIHRSLNVEGNFHSRPVHVGIILDEMALGEVSFAALRCSPVSIISLTLHIYTSFTFHERYTYKPGN